MLYAGVGFADSPGDSKQVQRAARKASEGALEGTGVRRPDAALVVTSWRDPGDQGAVAAACRDVLGVDPVVAPVHGVIAGDRESSEHPAVAVLAWCGVDATSFWIGDLAGHESAVSRDLELALGGTLCPRDFLLAFVDPAGLDLRVLLRSFERRPIGATWIGCGAGPSIDASGVPLWAGGHVGQHAFAGLVLRCERAPEVAVAQCGRAVSAALTVTRSEGHWILELDDVPALDRFRAAARGRLSRDLERATAHLLVALPCTKPAERALATGAYTVRPIRGLEPKRGGFAIAEPLRPGAQLAFVLRDAACARDALRTALGGPRAAACGVYLSCPARGRRLFDHVGLEAGYVQQAIGGTPFAGAFGAFQIAPLEGVPRLLNYAGVLARLDPKP